jgi:hypothetical protein
LDGAGILAAGAALGADSAPGLEGVSSRLDGDAAGGFAAGAVAGGLVEAWPAVVGLTGSAGRGGVAFSAGLLAAAGSGAALFPAPGVGTVIGFLQPEQVARLPANSSLTL